MKARDYILHISRQGLFQRVSFDKERALSEIDTAIATTPLKWEVEALKSARKVLPYTVQVERPEE